MTSRETRNTHPLLSVFIILQLIELFMILGKVTGTSARSNELSSLIQDRFDMLFVNNRVSFVLCKSYIQDRSLLGRKPRWC
jgi:hypothetical protein